MEAEPVISRRRLLAGLLGAGAAAGLSACGLGSEPTPIGPGAVGAAEAARVTTGRVLSLDLLARATKIDLGGMIVDTWTYGDALPGRALRATAGDRMRIAFRNKLPDATSVHWHGLAIRNDMDGVPGLTTPEVEPGGSFDFDFIVPDPGTYWLHPHTGLQLDRGLYAPFIIDDPAEPGGYDTEWVVVLDDWTDGIGPSPEQTFAALTRDGAGMSHGTMTGMRGGDVAYPLYLVNGRAPTDPDVLTARPRQRVRLRLINASADTVFKVALAGHQLRITHTDGYPVTPVDASALLIGMGERYDAVVTLGDGVFPLVAEPVGKTGLARALVRTGAGTAPAPSHRPRDLAAVPLTVGAVQVKAGYALARRDPDTVQDLRLSSSMMQYVWTINGRTYDDAEPLTIRQGQAGRFRIANLTMMPHPLHLHGHTFQIGPAGGSGPRKDTILIPAMSAIEVDMTADNPGTWMIHCHNAYHMEAGMMTRLDYVT
jgi:multicopper oxidase